MSQQQSRGVPPRRGADSPGWKGRAYRIVRHTHDIELASRLMIAELIRHYGCPGDGKSPDGFCKPLTKPDCPHFTTPGRPDLTYVRVQHALPNTHAGAAGWRFSYHEYERSDRGAFPAVVFR